MSLSRPICCNLENVNIVEESPLRRIWTMVQNYVDKHLQQTLDATTLVSFFVQTLTLQQGECYYYYY